MKRARRTRKFEAGTRNTEVPEGKEALETGHIICDGCTTIDARCLKSCLSCPVRCCAMETGVETCASCPKFPCTRLEGVWRLMAFRDAKKRLEKLNAVGRPRSSGG